MKTILFVTLILATSFVFARDRYDESTPLRKIMSSRDYDFDMPGYWIGGNTYTQADCVCIEGDNIRSKKTVSRCAKKVYTGSNGEPWKCVKYEDVYLYAPITYTKKVCLGWGNKQDHCVDGWEDVVKTLKTAFDIKIYRARMSGDGDKFRDAFPSFSKPLVVPGC